MAMAPRRRKNPLKSRNLARNPAGQFESRISPTKAGNVVAAALSGASIRNISKRFGVSTASVVKIIDAARERHEIARRLPTRQEALAARTARVKQCVLQLCLNAKEAGKKISVASLKPKVDAALGRKGFGTVSLVAINRALDALAKENKTFERKKPGSKPRQPVGFPYDDIVALIKANKGITNARIVETINRQYFLHGRKQLNPSKLSYYLRQLRDAGKLPRKRRAP